MAKDKLEAALIDEPLDQSVKVVAVEGAIATVSFAHHVHNITARLEGLID